MPPSTSASARQPQAARPLYQFDEYTTPRGQPALSVRLSIREMAKLYAEHPSAAGGYDKDWDSAERPSPYFRDRIHHAGQALDALDTFQFPATLKAEAMRASRVLAGVFEDVARLTIIRDLTAGKLDRRKFATLARTTAAGTFDVDTVRPYRRTQPTPSTPPTIAILASAAAAEMWNDESYIPRVLTLALSVQWACEAAGLRAYTALVREHCDLARRQPYRTVIEAFQIADPDSTISPKTYGIALHRDLWRYGIITTAAADYEGLKRLADLQDESATSRMVGRTIPSVRGGPATHWARQILSADIVIGIGSITDQPDIHLKPNFTLQQAVEQISSQARTLTQA